MKRQQILRITYTRWWHARLESPHASPLKLCNHSLTIKQTVRRSMFRFGDCRGLPVTYLPSAASAWLVWSTPTRGNWVWEGRRICWCRQVHHLTEVTGNQDIRVSRSGKKILRSKKSGPSEERRQKHLERAKSVELADIELKREVARTSRFLS